MNKYLEKIASMHELEPGVSYNLAKHDVVIDKNRMAEHLASRDRLSRGFNSVIPAVYGVGAGAAGGLLLAKKGYNNPSSWVGRVSSRFKERPLLLGGGLVGGLAGAGLGYATGGLDSAGRKEAKDALYARMERKHERKIDDLEGWN